MRTITLPATLESLSPLGQFVLDVAAEGGLDNVAAYRARLAVDEIATNAVLYGGAGDAAGGVIEAIGEVTADAVTITVVDGGAAFDPRQTPPPADMHLPLEERAIGGLGVHLALTGVDRFDYQRIDGRNRNIFVLHRPDGARP
jgi:anti-sigma regulatory factor (Ser/Thr protein kinase)